MREVYSRNAKGRPRLGSAQARVDAVEDELDGEGGEEHAEHAGEHVRAGLAEEPHDAGGEQEREEGEQQDEEEDADKDPEPCRAPPAGADPHRGYGAWGRARAP